MMPNSSTRPFPVPVVAALSPAGLVEEDTLDYLTMPQGMAMYQPPILPKADEVAARKGALRVLDEVLATLRRIHASVAAQRETACITLSDLDHADLTLVNQVLGEGEVSAQVLSDAGVPLLEVQESVFAGVWRVRSTRSQGGLLDYIEVGAVPEALRLAAEIDGARGVAVPLTVPAQIMNVPGVLAELEEQRRIWRAGERAHVVNLTLLPLTHQDIAFLDYRLGTGRVLILSRGYGNCRITNCYLPNTWRVVYYNSMDTVILNAVEVTDMPDVACAAPEDLRDSLERLQEVIVWVDQS